MITEMCICNRFYLYKYSQNRNEIEIGGYFIQIRMHNLDEHKIKLKLICLREYTNILIINEYEI